MRLGRRADQNFRVLVELVHLLRYYNMDPTTRILFFFIDLILPMAVGYLLRSKNWFHPAMFDRMIMFGILGIDPILICLSFWQLDFEIKLLWLPVLGIVMNIIPAVLAFVQAERKYHNSLIKGSYILATMLSNRGVVGTLTVFAIFGEPGYALAALLMLSSPIFLYLISYPMAERFFQQHENLARQRISLKSLFFSWKQVPMLGLLVGALLNFSEVPRPEISGAIFPYLVHMNAWLFVIPVGYAIEIEGMHNHWRDSFDLLWIKFVLTPIATYLMLLPLGLDQSAFNVVLILSFAPTAINAVVTARLFRLNVHIAAAAFVLSTIVYLVMVLPLLIWWFG